MRDLHARTLRALIAIGVASLLAMIAFALWGESADPIVPSEPGGSSHSALGHAAFAELLRASGYEVVISRSHSAERAGSEGLLVIAEPRFGDAVEVEALEEALRSDATILLVCPKYRGIPDRQHAEWIERAVLHPSHEIEALLGRCGMRTGVRRPDARATEWEFEGEEFPLPTLPAPQLLSPRAREVTPVVFDGRGVLVGAKVEDTDGYWGDDAVPRLWILSDPDILSNHGLGTGENAAFAMELIARAIPGDGPVVFDEVIHGAGLPESIWLAFGQWPLVLVLVHVLLLAGFVLWTALPRFGPPRPDAARGQGLDVLVESSSQLLLRGRHAEAALALAWDQARRTVLEHLRAPSFARAQAQVFWLTEIEGRRGTSDSVVEIDAAIRELRRGSSARGEDVLALARRVHQWRRELIHGDGERIRARTSPA